MLKKLSLAYLAGAISVLVGLVFLPAETILRYGFKLAAFETEYDWRATPRDATVTAYDARALLAEPEELIAAAKPKKGRR